MSDDEITAIHEAGHAVAHVRLGIPQGIIRVGSETLLGGVRMGSVSAESGTWTKEGAADQVLAYCAGYAALVAAGFPEEVAIDGADDDFKKARELIEFWGLSGGLEAARDSAVDFMRTPENVAAVRRAADHLIERRAIDGDLVDFLVDVADGQATEQDLARYLAFRAACSD